MRKPQSHQAYLITIDRSISITLKSKTHNHVNKVNHQGEGPIPMPLVVRESYTPEP